MTDDCVILSVFNESALLLHHVSVEAGRETQSWKADNERTNKTTCVTNKKKQNLGGNNYDANNEK